ncbi:MAG TPA: VWA domain-containing protein [Bryobacteraceae bacterium]|nr:VWA domain-containing protein [Bryobacteraceae bacterium]
MMLHRFLFLPALLLAGQTTIKVDVQLVNVAFAVRDAAGALVMDRNKDDFEVFEDGVPQNIAFFARGTDVPLTIGLIVDFSGSQEHVAKQHHRDLLAFLKSVLGPRDRAFLVCFGNHLRLASDLTGDSAEIIDRLSEFEKGKYDFPELGPPDEQRELGTAFYDAIYYAIAEKLAKTEGGRRALILFSDGEDNSSAHNMMDAIEEAQTENVLCFAVRYTESPHGRLTARNKYGTSVMDRIARETGALHFDARQGELKTHFAEIGDVLRSSYELAYHSTNPIRDGTFRKLVIRAKAPGLAVRAKTGYFAR